MYVIILVIRVTVGPKKEIMTIRQSSAHKYSKRVTSDDNHRSHNQLMMDREAVMSITDHSLDPKEYYQLVCHGT